MAHILYADTSPPLLQDAVGRLQAEGFVVVQAISGPEALECFQESDFDFVAVNFRLPLLSGLDVCRELRAQSPVPILVFSGTDHEVDRVVCLEVGADRFLAMPFSMHELLAHIRAILRRVRLDRAACSAREGEQLVIQHQTRRVYKGKKELSLTTREYEVLVYLAQHPDCTISREELVLAIWGKEGEGSWRALEATLYRLRSKVEDFPNKPRLIQTVSGAGYRLGNAITLVGLASRPASDDE